VNRDTNQQKYLIPAIAAHLIVTSLAWRDISRRQPRELRGGKTLWRTLTALNTGNSLLYVLIGRKR
jgi:hypothetical protein